MKLRTLIILLALVSSVKAFSQEVMLCDTVWQSDFSDPSDWTIGNLGGNNYNWVIGTIPPSGEFPLNPIQSTTASNGFALFDSDDYCSGNQNALISTSAPVNLADYSYVSVAFQQFYRRFECQTFVEVSTNGTDWHSIAVNSNLVMNAMTSNPDHVRIDISSLASGQAQVWIRFRFQGSCDYSWMIDDVSITAGNPNYYAESVDACGSYYWNGQQFTSSGTYYGVFPVVGACDSVVQLDLSIVSTSLNSSHTEVTTCASSYEWNGVTYAESGTYLFTEEGAECDSAAYLHITFNPVSSNASTTSITACGSYIWNGVTYFQSGTYLYSPEGFECDTASYLNLTITSVSANASYTDVAACGSYLWNGTTYTQSGQHQFVVEGFECDTVAYLNLTISDFEPVAQSVCMVSVDALSGKNMVIWEKPLEEGTSHFNVYRQNSSNSQFEVIAWVHYDSLSVFIDHGSSPAQNSNRYALTTVDTCGEEGVLSSPHRTIHLSANQGLNSTVNLSWNGYEGFSYPSFEVLRSSNADDFVLIGTVDNESFSFTDLSPPIGYNLYRVSVVNQNGCEPSREQSRAESNTVDRTITSVHSPDGSWGYSVSPNPSNGPFQVDGQLPCDVCVFDTLGKNVYAQRIENFPFRIELDRSTNGLYTVQLSHDKGTASFRLMMVH